MREIIINKDKLGNKIITLIENGILVERYEEEYTTQRLEGNIYLGKVQNVLPGMQAAFIDIGESKNTFIHLKDILPKIDVKEEKKESEIKKKNIKDIIKPGMPILVQVKRDSTNKKGARVSTHISLVSRFGVFMPDTNIITISQKIEEEGERKRLLDIAQKTLPSNTGIILRTSSYKKEEEIIKADIEDTIKRWEDMNKKVEQSKQNIPILIEQSDGLIKKILLDLIDQNIEKVIVNDKEVYDEIVLLIQKIKPNNRIELLLKKKENILDLYDINIQLEKIKNRKIWLRCGGFITIDKTEALTAIDVNSGKYIGTENLEQTVFTVNKEASTEIAKQLRLRDIGGIIVIDYIDMKEETNKQRIIEILKERLKEDRSKTQVLEFTKLNLLELTRKHMCSND